MIPWINKLRLITFSHGKGISGKSKVPQEKLRNFGRYSVVNPQNVSETLFVPSYITKPSYADSEVKQKAVVQKAELKTENQIECMRQSCLFARDILIQAKKLIEPGITTDFIDRHLHELIINNGGYPSPLNYDGFPKSICTSINNIAAHGIPDDRPLEDGDIINIDITVFLNGYHGDCSQTFEVGNVDAEGKKLIQITNECLESAANICRPGEKFCSIGKLIEAIAKKNGFNVIPCLVGHGIGNYFHGPPDIYHFDNDYPGVMEAGITFTIEPALTQGSPEVQLLEDGWTIATVDDARTAQAEHTILITNEGCDILT